MSRTFRSAKVHTKVNIMTEQLHSLNFKVQCSGESSTFRTEKIHTKVDALAGSVTKLHGAMFRRSNTFRAGKFQTMVDMMT